jgi:tetratricopeptide (TPR) repeat protein
LNEWITKLDPKDLNGYEKDSSSWTERELWYYYRVCGLAVTNNEVQAIELIDKNESEFFKRKKFFEMLKARAFIRLNKIAEASQIYEKLVSSRADWWILREYGKFLLDQKEEKKALFQFLNAALSPPMKLELKVTLFSEIANLLTQLDKKKEALPHLLLTKAVREREGWGIGDLDERIAILGGNSEETLRIDSLLKECQEIWQTLSGRKTSQSEKIRQDKNLKGKVINWDDGKPFCFIKTKDNQSYFCFKDDLPDEISNEQIVKFDLTPSFDKKKNQMSVKAVNISLLK